MKQKRIVRILCILIVIAMLLGILLPAIAKADSDVPLPEETGEDTQEEEEIDPTIGKPVTIEQGVYTIASALNQTMVLDVASASAKNKGNIQIYRSNGSNAQKFLIKSAGGGYYTITAICSNRALDVAGGRSASGTNIQQYKGNGTKAQKWKPIKATGDGAIVFESALAADKVMDVRNGKTVNKTNVWLYTKNGTKAQQFYLHKTSGKILQGAGYVVEIDPGHQTKSDSSLEPIGPGASVRKAKVTWGGRGVSTGKPEYVLNLEVSLKLKKELEKRGYKVFLTRSTHNVNLSNKKRAEKAYLDGADIFVRIHADHVSTQGSKGCFAVGPASNNPYLSKSVISNSQRLTKLLPKYQCKATGQTARSNSFVNNMAGINWAKMPVAIVEMGFQSNASEDRWMVIPSNQEKIAKGLANGIDAYFKGEKA